MRARPFIGRISVPLSGVRKTSPFKRLINLPMLWRLNRGYYSPHPPVVWGKSTDCTNIRSSLRYRHFACPYPLDRRRTAMRAMSTHERCSANGD